MYKVVARNQDGEVMSTIKKGFLHELYAWNFCHENEDKYARGKCYLDVKEYESNNKL